MRISSRLTLVSSCTAILLGCATDPSPSAPTAVPRQHQPSLAPEVIDAYVSGFGKHWGPAYAFSGYVLVTRHGERVFERAYGRMSLEENRRADADTRFRIGSLTKPFTAVAILQLAERNRLRVEDPVRKYLSELPETLSTITLHQLLSQTSGLASYTDDAVLMQTRGRYHAPEEVLASFADKPLAFSPGTRFEYSNSNYFLLGLVIEKVSGQTYEAYLQEHVLGPVGIG